MPGDKWSFDDFLESFSYDRPLWFFGWLAVFLLALVGAGTIWYGFLRYVWDDLVGFVFTAVLIVTIIWAWGWLLLGRSRDKS